MGKRLYVGNLAYSVTNESLEQLFAAFGKVVSAQVIQDRATGRSKGFGFVEMSDDTAIQHAIGSLREKEYNGRPLIVNEAAPRSVGISAFGEDRGYRRNARTIDTDRHLQDFRVEIFIPSADKSRDSIAINDMKSAVSSLMDELGYSPHPEFEPKEVYGSFLGEFFYQSKKALTSDEAKEIGEELKEGLRRKYSDADGAANLAKRAEAIAAVLLSIAPFQEAAVRLGDVIIIKATVRRKTRLIVEDISPQLARELAENPMLMRDPHQLIQFYETPRIAVTVQKKEDLPEEERVL